MSTTSNLQSYYCDICDQISHILKAISSNSMLYFELVGSVRCAAELSRMGREEEAKNLLIAAKKLRAVRKLQA